MVFFETVSVGVRSSTTLILYISGLKESYLWSKISSPGNGEVVDVSKSGRNSEKYRSPTGNSTLVLKLLSNWWKFWKLLFDLRNVKFWPMFQTPFLFQNMAGLASSSEKFLWKSFKRLGLKGQFMSHKITKIFDIFFLTFAKVFKCHLFGFHFKKIRIALIW